MGIHHDKSLDFAKKARSKIDVGDYRLKYNQGSIDHHTRIAKKYHEQADALERGQLDPKIREQHMFTRDSDKFLDPEALFPEHLNDDNFAFMGGGTRSSAEQALGYLYGSGTTDPSMYLINPRHVPNYAVKYSGIDKHRQIIAPKIPARSILGRFTGRPNLEGEGDIQRSLSKLLSRYEGPQPTNDIGRALEMLRDRQTFPNWVPAPRYRR